LCRILAVAAAALLLATPSRAYYQYVHYLGGRNGPFSPVYERFDLNALINQTVMVYVSDQSPAVYGPNDTFGSVLSQVKDAAATWNSVSSSQLHLSFAGLESPNQTSNTPGINVTFIDLPPGLLGLGGPTTSTIAQQGATGPFFPIVRSSVMLTDNTTGAPGPSYLEQFFTTAVHEFGHALGLQHSWTASAMSSPDITRNTSRARPIDADDIAGLSVLYGRPNWQANYGTISGRVTFTNSQPVSMASVVALTNTGPAISALTNPDGTYQIAGLPPNSGYLLYVHPLPPRSITVDNLGLRPPVDSGGAAFAASNPFQTVFYPGVLDPQQAALISVAAGATVGGQNFSVQPRSSLVLYNAQMYCKLSSATRSYVYNGDLAPSPAFMNTSYGPQTPGLLVLQPPADINTPIASFQWARILGWQNAYQTNWFTLLGSPQALALYFGVPLGAGTGPRHLVVNFGTDLYVMPDAVNLVGQNPPLIASVSPNPDGSVTVAGAGMNNSSAVYFDGLQAAVQTPFAGADVAGSITVLPPNGAAGQVATVTVYNSDGQNSMILQGQNPPTYPYNVSGTPQINTINYTALPAGSSAAIDITASSVNFVNGQTTVGFGTDDVTVNHVWVLSPTHLVANAVVAPGAAITPSDLSVIAGFQVIEQQGGFQTQVARPGAPDIALPIVNADPTQQTVYPGSIASINGTNLTLGSTAQVTLNGTPIPVQSASPTQVNVSIPAGFPLGPATLVLNNGGTVSFPVIVEIDNLPPAIQAVTNPSGLPLAGVTSNAGDMIDVVVSGLDPSVIGTPNLQVTVSGVAMTIFQVTPLPGGQYQLQVILTQSFGGAQVPLAVWVNGSSSPPVSITVR